MIDLDELERLREASTGGEWQAGHPLSKGAYHVSCVTYECGIPQNIDDSKYIAAVHNLLPDIIAELRAYRERDARDSYVHIGLTEAQQKELAERVAEHRKYYADKLAYGLTDEERAAKEAVRKWRAKKPSEPK